MERRVIGLILVLVAVALTAVSISTRLWWKGNEGSREVSVGTFSLETCRVRTYGAMAGQRVCEARTFEARGRFETFMLLGFVVTAAAALSNLLLIVTAGAAFTRRMLAVGWAGVVGAAIYLITAVGFIALAPPELARIGIGAGAFMALAAACFGAAGSVLVALSPRTAPVASGAPVAGYAAPPAGGYGPPPA